MKHFNIESVDRLKQAWALQDYVVADKIQVYKELESIQPGELVLISLASDVGTNVRSKWYGFSQFTSVKVVDAGNYIGNDVVPLIDLIDKIWTRQGIVLIISKNIDTGLYHALHDQLKSQIEHSASITRSPGDTFRLYDDISFVSLANQIHRCKPSHLIKSQNLITLRLGEMRAYFAESEPYIRHADCCFFDLNSVRVSDAPGQPNPSTSGLTSEEACHLSRYAGQGGKLKLFWIYNYTPSHDERHVTADLVAQMLWYFCEGVEHRRDKLPIDKSKLQAYVVEFDKLDIPLTFYKSPLTDRWWVTGSFDSDSQPMPCSMRDYETAKQGELSQRLLDLLHVYG